MIAVSVCRLDIRGRRSFPAESFFNRPRADIAFCSELLLGAKACLADDALPLRDFAAQVVARRIRTSTTGGEQDRAEVAEAGDDRGFGKSLFERAAQARYDRGGRASGSIERVPLRDLEPGKPPPPSWWAGVSAVRCVRPR